MCHLKPKASDHSLLQWIILSWHFPWWKHWGCTSYTPLSWSCLGSALKGHLLVSIICCRVNLKPRISRLVMFLTIKLKGFQNSHFLQMCTSQWTSAWLPVLVGFFWCSFSLLILSSFLVLSWSIFKLETDFKERPSGGMWSQLLS